MGLLVLEQSAAEAGSLRHKPISCSREVTSYESKKIRSTHETDENKRRMLSYETFCRLALVRTDV
jgi:hypothetical protein